MSERRGTAASRGYDSKWRRARDGYLSKHPLCVRCETEGRLTPATVVDHVVPHRGDKALFWDSDNWQALCSAHHNGAKQREERSGYVPGCDADGNPLDPGHRWNQPRRK